MAPQFIKTETGEELVVLSRRTYDALLARQGAESAEIRMTARMAEDYLSEKADGNGATIPHWFATLVAVHGSTLAAARRHASFSQVQLAEMLGISQGQLSDIERGRRTLSDALRVVFAERTGVEADWLV